MTETLAAEPVTEETLPERWEAVLIVEDEQTTDDRYVEPGALNWRELPIALTNALDTGDDHFGAVVGQIEEITRVGNEIRARGSFDLGSEAGREASRLVAAQLKRWISVDLEVIAYEVEEQGDCDEGELVLLAEDDTEDDAPETEQCRYVFRVQDGRIMGAAIVAFSAFPSAVIVPEGTKIPAATDDGRPAPDADEPVTAAAYLSEQLPTRIWRTAQTRPARPRAVVACGALAHPPASYFDDPQLAELQRWVSIEDGRVFGHIAGRGECHIGILDRCVTVDEIIDGGFDWANDVGHVVTDEGERIGTGPLPIRGGHAGLQLGWREAQSHYDDPSTVIADVRYGGDRHGIWCSGALRPGVTEEQVYALRASGVSLDARPISGQIRLVASCCVNLPGFPKVRARVASGELTALVAAGGRPQPAPGACACNASVTLATARAALDASTQALADMRQLAHLLKSPIRSALLEDILGKAHAE